METKRNKIHAVVTAGYYSIYRVSNEIFEICEYEVRAGLWGSNWFCINGPGLYIVKGNDLNDLRIIKAGWIKEVDYPNLFCFDIKIETDPNLRENEYYLLNK